MTSKTCSVCGETKSLNAFSRHQGTRDGLNPVCKSCISQKNKDLKTEKAKNPTDRKVVSHKYCSRCKLRKTKDEFYRNRKSKDGLTLWCIKCIRDYQTKYYEEHPDKKPKQTYRKDYMRSYMTKQREAVSAKETESEIHAQFRLMLDALSVPYEAEYTTGVGRVDFKITYPHVILLEIKRGISMPEIQRCLGQLLLYHTCHPMAKLYAYFGVDLPDPYRSIYAQHGISIWEWEVFYELLDSYQKN